MTTFHLHIKCNNAAFEDDDRGGDRHPAMAQEIARILRETAGKVHRQGELYVDITGSVSDINGNLVGNFWLEEEEA